MPTNDKARRSTQAAHAPPTLSTCRYCGKQTDDIPRHYGRECVHVAIAFDPEYWPYQEGSIEARNARNSRKQKKHAAYSAPLVLSPLSKRQKRFNNRRAIQRPVGGAMVLMADSDSVHDDAS